MHPFSSYRDIFFSSYKGNWGVLIMVFSCGVGIFKHSRWSPQAATFDSMPCVLAVIAHPDACFFQEVNIGMFA